MIPIPLKSVLLLFCQLVLGIPRGLVSIGLSVRISKALSVSPILTTCLTHLSEMRLNRSAIRMLIGKPIERRFLVSLEVHIGRKYGNGS